MTFSEKDSSIALLSYKEKIDSLCLEGSIVSCFFFIFMVGFFLRGCTYAERILTIFCLLMMQPRLISG